MMSPDHHKAQRLDEFLDGRLEGDELRAFEQAMLDDASLREAVEAHRTLQASLVRVFSPPAPPPDVLGAARGRSATTRKSGDARGWLVPRRTVLALAAVLLLALTAWLNAPTLFSSKPRSYFGERAPWRDVVAVYQDTVKAGYSPEWVCKDDAEFQEAVAKRLGQPLLLAQSHGVSALGWTYANTITAKTMCLLTTVDLAAAGVASASAGEPPAKVIVFVDRDQRGSKPTVDGSDGLNLYSRTIGQLCLYELSPLAQPVVLEHFYRP